MKTPKKNGLEFYSSRFPVVPPVKRGKKPYRLVYRWRIYKQGRIIGSCSEPNGYARLQGAVNNVRSIYRLFLDPKIVINPLGYPYGASVIQSAIQDFKSKKKR